MGNNRFNINITVTFLLFLIGAFGVSILLSIDRGLFSQQVIFLVLGFVLYFLFSRIDPVVLKWLAPIFYVFACVFLSMSYLGPNIRGATRWIIILGMQFQPSELVKPLLLVAFSFFLSKYPPRTLQNIALQTGLFIIPFFLVFKQPDLGSSLIYIAMWLSMMIAGGFSLVLFGIGTAIVFLSSPILWQTLASYQKMRILTFLFPSMDPRGAGYNAIQSMIAVGSGGIFGKGLGLGTQSHMRFLPEFHTDFIFATLTEELGFFGGTLLLFSYGILLWQVIRPFFGKKGMDDMFFIFTIGLFAMMLTQIAIHTGMNMGLLPITGITLPLVSYGGSSLLSVMSSFGAFESLKQGSVKDRRIAI